MDPSRPVVWVGVVLATWGVGAGCSPGSWVSLGEPTSLARDGGSEFSADASHGGGSTTTSSTSTRSSSSSSTEASSASSGSSQVSSSAGARDAGPDVDGSVPVEPTIVLDPASLMFHVLPVDSIILAVTGYDPVMRACVTMTWDYFGTDHAWRAQCDLGERFPLVSVWMDQPGPCEQWEPVGNTTVTEVHGCVDFLRFMRTGTDMVDVVASVASPQFTGKVVADNRSSMQPPPVTLGVVYGTDVPEDVFAQTIDCDAYQPTWVQVLQGGQPVAFMDDCFAPPCVEGHGMCGAAICVVENITQGSYSGSIFMTWDGWTRSAEGGPTCQVAPPGEYVARFCLGYRAQDGVVQDPFCHDVPFTLPAREVIWYASMGG